MVEQHLDLAQHLARLVDDAPDLERLPELTDLTPVPGMPVEVF